MGLCDASSRGRHTINKVSAAMTIIIPNLKGRWGPLFLAFPPYRLDVVTMAGAEASFMLHEVTLGTKALHSGQG